jgi:N-acetyl sugar amidotransferase
VNSIPEYTSCKRCILSQRDDRFIEFSADGICNHCQQFDEAWKDIPKTELESAALLEPVLDRIKSRGKGAKYDCLIGLSGGVDSSYIALLMKRYGLRPLAVHFDNGWNSELAVDNIQRVVSKLDIDLMTHVIDWDDFRALQVAYLKASVIDIEVLTDHAIYGTLYKVALDNGIKSIISGVNTATEIVLPHSWIYDKLDDANIKDIFKKFGDGRKLRNYPFVDRARRRRINSADVDVIRILDLIVYRDAEARSAIASELGWREYGGKHHESIFTKFYQCFILPRKFSVDKRRAHLSNLICSGQLTRQQALDELEKNTYSGDKAEKDLHFVLKKLQLTQVEFDSIMTTASRQHLDFDNYHSIFYHHPYLLPLRPWWEKISPRFASTSPALALKKFLS